MINVIRSSLQEIARKQNRAEAMTQYFFADEPGEPGFHKFRWSLYCILTMVQTPRWMGPMDVRSNLRKELHLWHFF